MSLRDFLFNNILQGQQGPQEHNPQLMAAAQQQMPTMPQAQNPLDSGAMSGIRAVRESLSSKPQTQTGMMGRISNILGRSLSNVGLAGLRASESPMARQLGGMYQTPQEMDAIEAARQSHEFDQNLKIMQHLGQQDVMRRQEEHRKDVLNEQKRYHDLMGARRGGRGQGGQASEMQDRDYPDFDFSRFPSFESKAARGKYETAFTTTSGISRELKEARKNIEKLESISKDNVFSPLGSSVSSANKVKDYLNKSGMANKNIQKEVILRNKIVSQLMSLEPTLEKGSKGAAPGESLLRRFHDFGVYFAGGDLPMNILKEKVNDLVRRTDYTNALFRKSLQRNQLIDYLPGFDEEEPGVKESTADDSQNQLVERLKNEYPALKGLNKEDVLRAYRDIQKRGVSDE